jgi:homospermidine synthase
MAKNLGVQTIQVSEIDTQLANIPFNTSTFFNTWSSVGFYEEATEPAQLGWGTHEIPIPNAFIDDGQCIIQERGMNVKVQGYEPTRGLYIGYCIPHGEAHTLSKYLATDDYNPSVYYVYKPSAIAEQSLRILRENDYHMQPFYHVLTSGDIKIGYDAVGALFLRTDKPAFWAGTIVEHHMVPDFVNPTCVQVVAGVLAGIDYIASHRNSGVIFPEQVDTSRVFDLIIPFLGTIFLDYVSVDLPTKFRDLIVSNDESF